MVTSKNSHDEKAKRHTITVTLEYAGEHPTDFECLEAVDQLLSSMPHAGNVKDGRAKKDTLIAQWSTFRSLE